MSTINLPGFEQGNHLLNGYHALLLSVHNATLPIPVYLGHELPGALVQFDNAPGFHEGEAVTFIPYFNCGHCIACRSGKPNYCVPWSLPA